MARVVPTEEDPIRAALARLVEALVGTLTLTLTLTLVEALVGGDLATALARLVQTPRLTQELLATAEAQPPAPWHASPRAGSLVEAASPRWGWTTWSNPGLPLGTWRGLPFDSCTRRSAATSNRSLCPCQPPGGHPHARGLAGCLGYPAHLGPPSRQEPASPGLGHSEGDITPSAARAIARPRGWRHREG
jgi:hypothetical protein